jgi:hypothetical protein
VSFLSFLFFFNSAATRAARSAEAETWREMEGVDEEDVEEVDDEVDVEVEEADAVEEGRSLKRKKGTMSNAGNTHK